MEAVCSKESHLFVLCCWGLLPIAIAGLTGCGSGGSALAPVVGTVTYEGTPLKTGIIQFEPSMGRSARGKIVDGQIQDVSTYEPGDGVMIGESNVYIFSFVREQVGMDIPPSVIPKRYNTPETSGLSVSIKPEEENVLDLKLTN